MTVRNAARIGYIVDKENRGLDIHPGSMNGEHPVESATLVVAVFHFLLRLRFSCLRYNRPIRNAKRISQTPGQVWHQRGWRSEGTR